MNNNDSQLTRNYKCKLNNLIHQINVKRKKNEKKMKRVKKLNKKNIKKLMSSAKSEQKLIEKTLKLIDKLRKYEQLTIASINNYSSSSSNIERIANLTKLYINCNHLRAPYNLKKIMAKIVSVDDVLKKHMLLAVYHREEDNGGTVQLMLGKVNTEYMKIENLTDTITVQLENKFVDIMCKDIITLQLNRICPEIDEDKLFPINKLGIILVFYCIPIYLFIYYFKINYFVFQK